MNRRDVIKLMGLGLVAPLIGVLTHRDVALWGSKKKEKHAIAPAEPIQVQFLAEDGSTVLGIGETLTNGPASYGEITVDPFNATVVKSGTVKLCRVKANNYDWILSCSDVEGAANLTITGGPQISAGDKIVMSAMKIRS